MGQPIEPQISTMVLFWAITFAIGVIIVGLLKFIFSREVKEVVELKSEIKKIPPPEFLLTETKHHVLCKATLEDVKGLIKENREVVTNQYKELRENMVLKVENEIAKILIELKRVNGGK